MKDIALFVLIIILLLGRKLITPAFSKSINALLLFLTIIFSFGFQWYVLRNLPVIDCLPFKPGNNILELRKMPANAIPDKKDYIFIYEKDGSQKEFTVNDLPDSTWKFVRRDDVIIEKGSNNEPPIKDYNLMAADGSDTTESILTMDKDYYLFYVNNIQTTSSQWEKKFQAIFDFAAKNGTPVMVITSDPENARNFFNTENKYNIPVLALDAVAFKTAARTNPELYLMHGPVIKEKWGKANLEKATK